ncbi:MAG TPA: hypothetical protein VE871_18600 [Longimicrobium sp.]|nr:hypothetical protein [Longimicrobium sp.]
MSDFATLLRLPERIMRRSLGLPLVMLGFFLVYFNALGSQERPTGGYLVFAFGSALTLAGLAFMAVELRRIGTPTVDVQSAVSASDLELTIQQLAKNLDIQRVQASQGFIAALAMMVLGTGVVLAGATGHLLGIAGSASTLTTVAGVVVEMISGLGMVLFRSTSSRLNKTSESLLDIWKLFAAFRHAETLPEAERTQMQIRLISRLVGLEGIEAARPRSETEPALTTATAP